MKLTDDNGIPTPAGAAEMFAAKDEARANHEWREAEKTREPLTITEALVNMRESLDRGETSLWALSDLEDAIRRMQTKPAVERTPETALRAMVRAYTDAAIEAEGAYFRSDEQSADETRADALRNRLDEALVAIRGELGYLCASGEMDTSRDWPEWVGKDYEARLAGTTPLDAPPAKN
jgi:hypothetical protein